MAATPSGSRPVVEPTGRMIMPQQSRMDSVPSFRSSRDFESLKTERARLDSFSLPPGWPVTFITPDDCAKAGFFYLQDGDKVQCAFCRGVAGEWEEGDNPSTEHRRHFPRCPFVCNLPVGNIPIGLEIEAAQIREQEVAAGIDICGPFALAARYLGQEPASIRGAQPLDGDLNDVATSLAIQVCGNGPMHKNLVTYQSRVKSFTTKWPSTTSGQTPESLAEAGFAYLGHLDHVKCFYCDGGLRNWEPGDDPWLEHARWFPNCSFVILNKGDGYVTDVLKGKPEPPQFPLAADLPKGYASSQPNSSTPEEETAAPKPSSKPPTSSASSSSSSLEVPTTPDEEAHGSNKQRKASSSSQESTTSSSSEEEALEEISTSGDDNKNQDNDSGTESQDELTSPTDVFCMKEVKKEIELEEELRKLREATQCKICMDNRVEVVFLPCGHLVSCTRCATALSNCAVCRQPIKAYVKTYLS